MAWSDAARAAAAEARRRRAQLSHKPSTAAKQRLGESQEARVARMIRARRSSENSPVDAQLRLGGRLHGVEVKAFMDNKNNKITMHPASLVRKSSWARKERARLHTVLVDVRRKTHAMYYRRGVGSFRLSTMTRVSTPAHLRSLIGGV